MGTITIDIPQSGEPDRTGELKVSNALQTIATTLNGGIDSANIKDGSIALGDLAPATQAAMGAPPQVSSLPAAPVDGQEAYLLVDTTTGVQWHMRYRSGSASTYKWEFLGGGTVTAEATVGSAPTSANVWTDPGDMHFNLPTAGDYIISFGGFCFNSSVNQSSRVGMAATNLAPSVNYAEFVQSSSTSGAGAFVTRTIRANAISGVLSLQVNLNATTGYVDRRWFTVTPVRLLGATS
jgi:hypothetical protein